jgi:hypothetical protein
MPQAQREDRLVNKLEKLDAKTIRIGIAGLIALVVVVVIAINVFGGSDSSSSPNGGESSTRETLSESELISKAGELEHTVYWVGSRPGTENYELTTASGGSIYIRYLTGGAKAGDPRPDFLTVGTYSVPDAKAALHKAETTHTGSNLTNHEGYDVLEGKSGTDAYVVFDDQPELQIEIFSPNPGEAVDLATSGALTPLG